MDGDVYTFENTDADVITEREVLQARQARRLYHDLNAKSVAELIVWQEVIISKNVPVSFKDVELVDNI